MSCVGIGRLLGHRYRARYSTKESRPFWATPGFYGEIKIHGQKPQLHISSRTYEGDVCERCGDVVNREVANSTHSTLD